MSDPVARVIAKKSICFELCSGLLSKRLNANLESVNVISIEQHRFRRERSTEVACRIVTVEVKRILAMGRTFCHMHCSSILEQSPTQHLGTMLCSRWPS